VTSNTSAAIGTGGFGSSTLDSVGIVAGRRHLFTVDGSGIGIGPVLESESPIGDLKIENGNLLLRIVVGPGSA
jgi:hypothetical protein